MSTEGLVGFDRHRGAAPPRYIDALTDELGVLAQTFEDLQDSRQRHAQRGMGWLADEVHELERRVGRQLGRRLRSHDLWPFLEPLKGLSGPLGARAVAMIQDPWRFPGQPCSEGHIIRPGVFPAGHPCPVAPADSCPANEEGSGGGDSSSTIGRLPASEAVVGGAGSSSPTAGCRAERDVRIGCGGSLLTPRTGTGVRSLWHYAGLHATTEGKLPQRRKGVVADWKPSLRTICLQPDGLADQIVRHSTPRYRDIYDEKKASKLLADYPPWRAHRIAKTVAVKAFLGDLLIEWKKVTTT